MRQFIGATFVGFLGAAALAAQGAAADPSFDPEEAGAFVSEDGPSGEEEEEKRSGGTDRAGADSPPAFGPLPPVTDLTAYINSVLRPPDEPSLAEVIALAVEYAGLEPEAEDDLASGAAWAALLPRLRVTFRREWEHDRWLDLEYDGTGDFGIDTDDDIEFGITAQWQLSDLVAPPAAISARRLAVQADAARRTLRLTVARAYVERRQLRLQWDAVPPEQADVRSAIAAAIAERTAQLDALTGGRFGRAVSRVVDTMERGDEWSSDEIDDTR